jgi:uncharacterized protein DUF4384
MVDLARTRPDGCLSDRALDMMMAGELAPELRAKAEQHLPGCAACSARHRELEAARAAFPLEAPNFSKVAASVPTARASRRWWAFGGAFAAAAAAAALVLVWRIAPEGDSVRTKGGEKLGFFVMHEGSVREGAPGEMVQPGDRLQIVYTATQPRYLAIFSRDAEGATSVAFPRAAVAAKIEAGSDTPLPYSLELDGAPGIETLHGLFCDRPLPLEPLRQSLHEQGDRTVWPAGCRVDRISYGKKR